MSTLLRILTDAEANEARYQHRRDYCDALSRAGLLGLLPSTSTLDRWWPITDTTPEHKGGPPCTSS